MQGYTGVAWLLGGKREGNRVREREEGGERKLILENSWVLCLYYSYWESVTKYSCYWGQTHRPIFIKITSYVSLDKDTKLAVLQSPWFDKFIQKNFYWACNLMWWFLRILGWRSSGPLHLSSLRSLIFNSTVNVFIFIFIPSFSLLSCPCPTFGLVEN